MISEWLSLFNDARINSLLGVNIIESDFLPVRAQTIKLKTGVMVTETFRNEFDAWLLDRFGQSLVVYQTPQGLLMHPEIAKHVNAAISNITDKGEL